jgi:hypothetical protein
MAPIIETYKISDDLIARALQALRNNEPLDGLAGEAGVPVDILRQACAIRTGPVMPKVDE